MGEARNSSWQPNLDTAVPSQALAWRGWQYNQSPMFGMKFPNIMYGKISRNLDNPGHQRI